MLSNDYPGSRSTGKDDRARTAEDAATTFHEEHCCSSRRNGIRLPEPRALCGSAALQRCGTPMTEVDQDRCTRGTRVQRYGVVRSITLYRPGTGLPFRTILLLFLPLSLGDIVPFSAGTASQLRLQAGEAPLPCRQGCTRLLSLVVTGSQELACRSEATYCSFLKQ